MLVLEHRRSQIEAQTRDGGRSQLEILATKLVSNAMAVAIHAPVMVATLSR